MKWVLVLIVIAVCVWYYVYKKPGALESLGLGSSQQAEATPTPVPTPIKHLAPQGIYYLVQPISITNDSGIVGINAGTKVTFVKDTGQSWLVTDGQTQFEVTQSQLTNDIDVDAAVIKEASQHLAPEAAGKLHQQLESDREADAARQAAREAAQPKSPAPTP
jgi:hypothetical protein